jgi:hypothetical protein
MSKFNQPVSMKARATSPIHNTTPATTHQGGAGFARDAKSELFLLAVANMVGEHTFYETADARDTRFEELVHQVAVQDPDWMCRFIPWLRGEANMRSASIVAAAEAVKARLDAGSGASNQLGDHMTIGYQTRDMTAGRWNRRMIDAACQRADEPGEMLGYWTSRHGRALPKPVKRGVADAVARLYNGKSLLKYDTDSKGYRFGDVIDLVHPAPHPDKPWQGELFRYALDRRHGREDARLPESNRTLAARVELMELPVKQRRAVLLAEGGAERLAAAGMTWEALAGWLQGPMDATAWEAIIPSMGYMALLRNLRNFDQAGVSDEAVEQVAARLADPEQVARSRQFPFRFYAAHKNTGSLRWGHALEKALKASLANVPMLPGRTLVLIDQSPSMFPGYHFSTRNTSDIALAEKAALFGAAIALRAEHADLVGYGIANYKVPHAKGDAVLEVMKRFHVEDGTDTPRAMVENFAGHDRVLIVTDEQTAYSRLPGRTVENAVPANVPVYTWNLAGYRPGHGPSGTARRHTFGGLADQAFRMIPLLEAGESQAWPF